MLSNLITDRTVADVQRWRTLRDKGINNMTATELEEWKKGMKGAYNASDLNRVSGVMNYLRDRLAVAGYLAGNEFDLKFDWEGSDILFSTYFSKYIKAVATVRNALALYRTTPEVPIDTASLDYQEANNIEKILIDVDVLITKMQALPFYCGEIFSGEL